jgi:hypothetical protein
MKADTKVDLGCTLVLLAFSSILVLIVMVLCSGCGGVLKNLDRTNELTAELTKGVRPMMKEKAKDAQDECFASAKKAGKPAPKKIEDCPGHKKVWDFRRAYYKIANGIHLGVKAGAIACEMKDERGAMNIAAKVAAGLLKLKEMVIKAGYLKDIGL